jgi:hypothetical protein
MTKGLWLVAGLALLAGCAEPGQAPVGSPQAQADAATMAACRQRADQVYNVRHRDTIYAAAPNVNVPSSGSYAPGAEDQNLAGIFERDSMLSDCVRNTGVEGDRTP